MEPITLTDVVAPEEVGDGDRALRWSELIRGFLNSLRGHGYSLLTLRDYHSDIAQLRDLVAAMPEALTDADTGQAIDVLARRGFGDAVLRRKRAAHHCFLAYLRSRQVTAPLISTLWARAASEPIEDRVMLGFVIAAGVRLCELPGIEGRDIRVRTGVLAIRSGLRLVPLHPALRGLLDDARREFPIVSFRPVLPGLNGFPVNGRTMHARFRRLVERLGAPEVRPDDLRRATAAHLLKAGAPNGLVLAFLARDRGRPVAPRRGKLVDLTCLAPRLFTLPMVPVTVGPGVGAARVLAVSEGG